MLPHSHNHSHAPGERHPHSAATPSLLRLSALGRVLIAALLNVILWGAVIWAVGPRG